MKPNTQLRHKLKVLVQRAEDLYFAVFSSGYLMRETTALLYHIILILSLPANISKRKY